MITFIEKKPFTGPIINGRQGRYFPIYMVKDGKEHFVTNREESPTCVTSPIISSDIKGFKKMLRANNGQYFRLFGHCENPFDLIAEMKKRRHHFTEPKKVFSNEDVYGYTDFSGNLKEVSAAFKYRIYDEEMVRQLKVELEDNRK